ncbi:hotdog domain-containing protein [Streptomyces sp. NPDC057456]|uniref:hotdog domain-containing protein n=1 Tax=Streptomyces sp. NPDC057456 TaxID=3346139 RepID=UPI0036A206F1
MAEPSRTRRTTPSPLPAPAAWERGVATAGLNVHFLRPARGSLVIAQATVTHLSARRGTVDGSLLPTWLNPASVRKHRTGGNGGGQ